jgi:Tfp pilus assembly protein PilX
MKNIKVFKKAQTGAVLIVVLVMLILLTIAGTWAIRSGLISLNIATNSQAQSLLMQNSDSVFLHWKIKQMML